MRKLSVLLIAMALCFSLAGCGELTPIEKCQQKAVSIGEQFLNFEITGVEAREQLGALVVPETEGNGQVYLDADIGYLSFIIAKRDVTYEEIKERVDDIKTSTYE